MSPLHSFLRHAAAGTLVLSLLSACKPIEENTAQSGDLVRDPSGLMVPVPGVKRAMPAAREAVFLVASAADPRQRVQANRLLDVIRASEGFSLVSKDAKKSAATQSKQLEELATSKPAAVFLLPVNAAEEKEHIAALRAAGTIVIGLDASLNDGSCDTVVFCDQKKIGSLAGGVIVSALERKAQDEGSAEVKGRVVQIQGDESQPACKARSEGFLEAIKSKPGIVIVHDASAGWDKANAAQCLKDALRLQKTFDTVYAHNDMLALGASEAAINGSARESLLIVGTDGVNGPGGGLEMLRKGLIDATIYQPLLVDFAWQVVQRMMKDPAFKPKPSYELEPVAFTPKTLDELKQRDRWVPEL